MHGFPFGNYNLVFWGTNVTNNLGLGNLMYLPKLMCMFLEASFENSKYLDTNFDLEPNWICEIFVAIS